MLRISYEVHNSASIRLVVSGSEAAASVVASNAFSSGLVDFSTALRWNLSVARFRLPNGSSLSGDKLVRDALVNLSCNGTELCPGEQYGHGQQTAMYPFAYTLFMVLANRLSSPAECDALASLYKLLAWTWSDGAAAVRNNGSPNIACRQRFLEAPVALPGFVPLPQWAVEESQRAVLRQAVCAGRRLRAGLAHGWEAATAAGGDGGGATSTAVQFVSVLCAVALATLLAVVFGKRWRLMKRVTARNWVIAEHDVKMGDRLSIVNSRLSLR